MAEFRKDRVGLIAIIAIALLALSTFLQIIAVGTDNWVDTVAEYNGEVVGSSGLWKICTHPFNDRESECRFFRWEDVQVSRKLGLHRTFVQVRETCKRTDYLSFHRFTDLLTTD